MKMFISSYRDNDLQLLIDLRRGLVRGILSKTPRQNSLDDNDKNVSTHINVWWVKELPVIISHKILNNENVAKFSQEQTDCNILIDLMWLMRGILFKTPRQRLAWTKLYSTYHQRNQHMFIISHKTLNNENVPKYSQEPTNCKIQ